MGTSENPHAGQGMVVLDIGGDIGALVISAPEAMVGAEIEICPAGNRRQVPDEGGDWWQGDWHSHSHTDAAGGHTHGPAWPHVEVLRRHVGDGHFAAAVYPGLRAGTYELWLRPGEPTAMTVTIEGGTVTETEWPPVAAEVRRPWGAAARV